MEEEKKLRMAAMADIHVQESDRGRWVDLFKVISGQADVLLICGDLTNTGDEAEAETLCRELAGCTIPVIAVLGNHDYEKGRQKQIRKILQQEHIHILDGESVVIGDVGFAGVKGFGGGFDHYMLSMFGEEPMKAFVQEAVKEALMLDRALTKLEQHPEHIKKIALLHYSPVSATVAGEPEPIFPFLGCSRLAEPLIRRKVDAVFHGHAHAGILQAETEGIRIFNVARPVLLKAGYEKPFFMLEL
jgi:Icc-related predicted phosphoesterase